MKKFLSKIIRMIGFVFIYVVGDVTYQTITGKDEIPVYYWICVGLSLVHQIMMSLKDIKNKLEEKSVEQK